MNKWYGFCGRLSLLTEAATAKQKFYGGKVFDSKYCFTVVYCSGRFLEMRAEKEAKRDTSSAVRAGVRTEENLNVEWKNFRIFFFSMVQNDESFRILVL